MCIRDSVQFSQLGHRGIVADLTDRVGVAAFDRTAGDIDLHVAGIPSRAGINDDCRTIIADAVAAGIFVAEHMIVDCATNCAAADIQRAGLDTDCALAFDQTAINVGHASLRLVDGNAGGRLHLSTIIDVDRRSALRCV